MEKLTIKELAPYLPYRLKGVFQFTDEKVLLTSIDMFRSQMSVFGSTLWNDLDISEFKPLLRPLSSLTEEDVLELASTSDPFFKWQINRDSLFRKSVFCIHNGDRYGFSINTNGTKLYSINTTINGHFIQTNNPKEVIQRLHEWHFDVFGLIDRGIALPIDGKEAE